MAGEVKYPCFIEKKNAKGEWIWGYFARNGEQIAKSSESYVKHADCTHSIELLKGSKTHKIFVAKPKRAAAPSRPRRTKAAASP
ncbi:MAG: DUF1508 domain-containing protein [Bauldia sp.]|nr:DUF1508 domain-containing protein [Bauldia sp.]